MPYSKTGSKWKKWLHNPSRWVACHLSDGVENLQVSAVMRPRCQKVWWLRPLVLRKEQMLGRGFPLPQETVWVSPVEEEHKVLLLSPCSKKGEVEEALSSSLLSIPTSSPPPGGQCLQPSHFFHLTLGKIKPKKKNHVSSYLTDFMIPSIRCSSPLFISDRKR